MRQRLAMGWYMDEYAGAGAKAANNQEMNNSKTNSQTKYD